MRHTVRALLLLAAALICACNEPKSSVPSPEEPQAAAKPAKDPGEALFESRCLDCHRLNGRGGQAGPDLTDIITRANSDYVESVVCNPRSHFPGTAMPSFEGKLTEKELRLLADYVCGGK